MKENAKHTPKLTPDGHYTIEGKHNCGCKILRPLGATYSIIDYCPLHAAAPKMLTLARMVAAMRKPNGKDPAEIGAGMLSNLVDAAAAAITKSEGR